MGILIEYFKLEWTEPAPPTEGVCHYDHVIAQSPQGEFRIIWKSWKKGDTYDVEFPWDLDGYDSSVERSGSTLEEAKAIAQKAFEDRVLRCIISVAERE